MRDVKFLICSIHGLNHLGVEEIMAPRSERARKALNAMKDLGISEEDVMPVLTRLFKLYGKEWELIEAENYRALIDAYYEYVDTKSEEMEPPMKKQHLGKSNDKVPTYDAKGKSAACLRKEDKAVPSNAPDSHDSGNAIVPWEGQPTDQSLELANPSQMCTGSISSSDQAVVFAKSDGKKLFHTIRDIAKGTEKVKISLVDEIGNEALPNFVYCPENIVYESANVHVSLARIADEDCCSDCKGDCLSSSIPCHCAGSTGGEYAYTVEGCLTQKFLQTCISSKVSPNMEDAVFCKDCPLERAKNVDLPGSCQGHILKKFITECWRKCGCDMRCGNRVVQRRITKKLEVFLTREGKGWGLRPLKELPQGAFVCEYVGEILTNIELYDRNIRRSADRAGKHFYPVLLDADWSTEENLKDEEALCLDATNYGNVARFINHRCHDGNLIEVPVRIETPDRHYYHLAFFTTRKVDALEELTWDYGIDFLDKDHPIKAFRCNCGSGFCRDKMPRR